MLGFDGHLDRLAFLIVALIYLLAIIFAYMFMAIILVAGHHGTDGVTLHVLAVAGVFTLVQWMMTAASARRARAAGWPAWISVFTLPLFFPFSLGLIVTLLIPGTTRLRQPA